jgi:hypothetical protein
MQRKKVVAFSSPMLAYRLLTGSTIRMNGQIICGYRVDLAKRANCLPAALQVFVGTNNRGLFKNPKKISIPASIIEQEIKEIRVGDKSLARQFYPYSVRFQFEIQSTHRI